jgi:ribosomal protein L11 methyltransferase
VTRLIRLGVRVAREDVEVALAELLVLSPAGLEEVDLPDGRVELALYGAPGELPALPMLQAVTGTGSPVEVVTSEVAADWSERWREFHRPVTTASPSPAVPGIHVRPPWEPAPSGEPPVIDLVIDPGQAFGTGAHATTRLCLGLLLELAADGEATGSLLDIGCGSGVLALAAARLGHEPVLALDHERESVEATRANARVNGIALDVRRSDLRHDPLPAAEVIAANLLRPLHLELSRRLGAVPARPRHLLAGGLLVGEEDEVASAFAAAAGLRERARRRDGEWAALWLVR